MIDLFRFEVAALDDAGDMQTLRGHGFAGEELAQVHRAMPFGLASHPPAGSHGLALALQGRRDLVAVLGLEHPQYRQRNLPAGQAALYDSAGNVIWAKGGEGLRIDAAGRPVKIKGASLTLEPAGTGPAVVQVGDLTIKVTGTLRIESGDTRIGPAGAPTARVSTESGPSSVLRAAV